jgi:hypothetical protein
MVAKHFEEQGYKKFGLYLGHPNEQMDSTVKMDF